MVKVTKIKGNIDDIFWLEIVLAMTHIIMAQVCNLLCDMIHNFYPNYF